jgi:hypothetical protein
MFVSYRRRSVDTLRTPGHFQALQLVKIFLFDDIGNRGRVKQGREFGHASFEPIFYLVFPPNQILNVKRETPAWMYRLRNEGWEVETFSIAEHAADIIEKAPLRKIWLAADQKAPLAWDKTNASLANAISNGALQARIEAKLAELEGKHRFIDKVHVRYVEKEKRHWASLENFNSQRIAIGEKFYRDNDRLLEGGIWAEVTLAHNAIEEDDYAFYIEDLRPIQISRFDFERYCEGRTQFTRDEWIAAILRTVGLEPTKLSKRVQMHFVARLKAWLRSPEVATFDHAPVWPTLETHSIWQQFRRDVLSSVDKKWATQEWAMQWASRSAFPMRLEVDPQSGQVSIETPDFAQLTTIRQKLQAESPSLFEVEPLQDGTSVRIRRSGRGEARWVGQDE